MINVGEHLASDCGESSLGVTHRGGGVAVNRTEVSLSINEWVTHGEVLRQADECVIEGAVAVWVVLAHHLTHDRSALAIGGAAREAHLTHRVEDAAVDRLEPVAHVWKGTRHDHAHRVIEVARAHLVFDTNRLNSGDADAVRANPVCAVIYGLICHLVTPFLSALLRVKQL